MAMAGLFGKSKGRKFSGTVEEQGSKVGSREWGQDAAPPKDLCQPQQNLTSLSFSSLISQAAQSFTSCC
jgi:hypothetical protein